MSEIDDLKADNAILRSLLAKQAQQVAGGSTVPLGSKILTRAKFNQLSPADRMQHVKAGGTITD
jgi:hypothetical protein